MAEPSVAELQSIRSGVARIAKLSDGLIKLGGLRLGIDGVLAWIPGVGEIYSAGAGVYLLTQGVRAGVPVGTLASCAALLLGRTTITAIPLAGPLAADFLTAHRWSAQLILKAIDHKLAAAGIASPSSRGGSAFRMWSGKRPAGVSAA